MAEYQAMFKYELANAAGVTTTIFRRCLRRYEKELGAFKCKKYDKILPPCAVIFLCEKSVIVLDVELDIKKNRN